MISPLLLLLLLPLFSPFEVKEEEKTGEGVYFEVPEIRASPPCPTGWILIDKGNTTTSYCYFQPDLSLTWADARAYCQNIGGELVSLYNRTEYDEVIASVVKPSIYLTYTGLYRNGSTWRWSDGTSTSTAAYWLPGQPDANGGNCSAWKTSDTSGFQTVPCQKSQPFICKQMAARCAPYRSGTSISTGSFTSPNYPNNYENNLDCFYYVVYTYRNNTVVYINFSPFDLEARYDYVTLYDGPDTTAPILVANVSGNYSYETHFESSYNALTVHFHTDGSITRKGFNANWRILTVPDIIYLNESNFGEVSSVNYPQTYDNYINQEYYFTTDPGFQVNLTFDAFITEQRYDYVLAFDGPLVNGTSPLIANLTGNLTQTILDTGAINLLSSNNTLTLKFITDASVVRTGWHLFYNYV